MYHPVFKLIIVSRCYLRTSHKFTYIGPTEKFKSCKLGCLLEEKWDIQVLSTNRLTCIRIIKKQRRDKKRLIGAIKNNSRASVLKTQNSAKLKTMNKFRAGHQSGVDKTRQKDSIASGNFSHFIAFPIKPPKMIIFV